MFSANQETLAALVQFFSTAFSSGESATSVGDLPTVSEEPVMDSYQTQADVSPFYGRVDQNHYTLFSTAGGKASLC